MSELLFDVNLQQMPDEYLNGDWCVADRVLNRNRPDTPLAQATTFSLRPGTVRVEAPQIQDAGHWTM